MGAQEQNIIAILATGFQDKPPEHNETQTVVQGPYVSAIRAVRAARAALGDRVGGQLRESKATVDALKNGTSASELIGRTSNPRDAAVAVKALLKGGLEITLSGITPEELERAANEIEAEDEQDTTIEVGTVKEEFAKVDHQPDAEEASARLRTPSYEAARVALALMAMADGQPAGAISGANCIRNVVSEDIEKETPLWDDVLRCLFDTFPVEIKPDNDIQALGRRFTKR